MEHTTHRVQQAARHRALSGHGHQVPHPHAPRLHQPRHVTKDVQRAQRNSQLQQAGRHVVPAKHLRDRRAAQYGSAVKLGTHMQRVDCSA